MKALNLENINSVSPYSVTQRVDSPCVFSFQTDFGVEYEIVINRR